jgi:hypothetical protein
MFRTPRCSHGATLMDLACQAVGAINGIFTELQTLNGRLFRMERFLAAHIPDYPQLSPNEREQARLREQGISGLPAEEVKRA